MLYVVCNDCGCSLDFNEKCDCNHYKGEKGRESMNQRENETKLTPQQRYCKRHNLKRKAFLILEKEDERFNKKCTEDKRTFTEVLVELCKMYADGEIKIQVTEKEKKKREELKDVLERTGMEA